MLPGMISISIIRTNRKINSKRGPIPGGNTGPLEGCEDQDALRIPQQHGKAVQDRTTGA
jgi:hypothetical protein